MCVCCRGELGTGDAALACTDCNVPLHWECYRSLKRCPTAGCAGRVKHSDFLTAELARWGPAAPLSSTGEPPPLEAGGRPSAEPAQPDPTPVAGATWSEAGGAPPGKLKGRSPKSSEWPPGQFPAVLTEEREEHARREGAKQRGLATRRGTTSRTDLSPGGVVVLSASMFGLSVAAIPFLMGFVWIAACALAGGALLGAVLAPHLSLLENLGDS